MMHEPEKSDSVVVAGKPANKAEQPAPERSAAKLNAAELVERRARTEGNAIERHMRAGHSTGATHGERSIAAVTLAAIDPRWEPYAGKPHVRICAGGGEQSPSLPRPSLASTRDGSYRGISCRLRPSISNAIASRGDCRQNDPSRCRERAG